MILHCYECGDSFSGNARERQCPTCGADCGDQVDIHVDEQFGHGGVAGTPGEPIADADLSDLEERLLANRDSNWDYRPR